MTRTYRIALIPGDGVGTEVLPAEGVDFVVVGSNLFGDILSDLTAGVAATTSGVAREVLARVGAHSIA